MPGALGRRRQHLYRQLRHGRQRYRRRQPHPDTGRNRHPSSGGKHKAERGAGVRRRRDGQCLLPERRHSAWQGAVHRRRHERRRAVRPQRSRIGDTGRHGLERARHAGQPRRLQHPEGQHQQRQLRGAAAGRHRRRAVVLSLAQAGGSNNTVQIFKYAAEATGSAPAVSTSLSELLQANGALVGVKMDTNTDNVGYVLDLGDKGVVDIDPGKAAAGRNVTVKGGPTRSSMTSPSTTSTRCAWKASRSRSAGHGRQHPADGRRDPGGGAELSPVAQHGRADLRSRPPSRSRTPRSGRPTPTAAASAWTPSWTAPCTQPDNGPASSGIWGKITGGAQRWRR